MQTRTWKLGRGLQLIVELYSISEQMSGNELRRRTKEGPEKLVLRDVFLSLLFFPFPDCFKLEIEKWDGKCEADLQREERELDARILQAVLSVDQRDSFNGQKLDGRGTLSGIGFKRSKNGTAHDDTIIKAII